jgi:DNA-binding MarR family transcriptional regulator
MKADLQDAREAETAANTDEDDDAELSDEGQAVVATFDGSGEMSASEIASAAGMEVSDLRPVLGQLIDAGRIEQVGRGRGTRYRLAEGGGA